jgi:hypothetical protein
MTIARRKGQTDTRLNSLCPYYTMFPVDFPLRVLGKARKGDIVYDPFCGRGTTNFAARLHGLRSFGVDSSPVATAIASAKLVAVGPTEISLRCQRILSSVNETRDIPHGAFWKWCYHPDTLDELCRLREYLLSECEEPVDVALRALILGVLHGPLTRGKPSYASNQMPRTYATKPGPAVNFWMRHDMRPPRVDLLDLVQRRSEFSFAASLPDVGGRIWEGDSRHFILPDLGRKPSWVVTSPPYFGMRSYIPDQWLRNWFLGGPSDVEYTQRGQVRHHRERFTGDLAMVWKNVAGACEGGARMIVRFGSLPSEPVDAKKLLVESLQLADAGWRVSSIRSAGIPGIQRRQATQFKRTSSGAQEEFDVYVRLEK